MTHPIEFLTRLRNTKIGAKKIYHPGLAMANEGFSYRAVEKLTEIFSKHGVEYLFIGKSGAILYGFPDTTQDVDLFPKKDASNGQKIVDALVELGFPIDNTLKESIIAGKDVIQIRGGPFDIDFIFAPDGIKSFEQAKKRAQFIENKYPVAHLEDIIKSKKSAGRQRDKESLPRLKDFYNYLLKERKIR